MFSKQVYGSIYKKLQITMKDFWVIYEVNRCRGCQKFFRFCGFRLLFRAVFRFLPILRAVFVRFCGFRLFFRAVLRFSSIFSCGFAVFADFSCGFAVSIIAYCFRFPTEVWCGYSIFGHFELRFCGFYCFQTFGEF